MFALGIGIAVIGAALLIALNVIHMRRYGRFLKHLEKHHTEHWTSIGSPLQFEDEPQFGSIGYAQYFSGRGRRIGIAHRVWTRLSLVLHETAERPHRHARWR